MSKTEIKLFHPLILRVPNLFHNYFSDIEHVGNTRQLQQSSEIPLKIFSGKLSVHALK